MDCGQRKKGLGSVNRKPYEGHESLTGYLLSLAIRAGVSERDFWKMTVFTVVAAFDAALVQRNEEMTLLAYRTGLYASSFRLSRVKLNKLPMSEAELLKKPKAKNESKRQSLEDQLAMAKFVTRALGGTVD